jgi:hypothetical protein
VILKERALTLNQLQQGQVNRAVLGTRTRGTGLKRKITKLDLVSLKLIACILKKFLRQVTYKGTQLRMEKYVAVVVDHESIAIHTKLKNINAVNQILDLHKNNLDYLVSRDHFLYFLDRDICTYYA